MSSKSFVDADWQRSLSELQPIAVELLGKPEDEQRRRGYFHTLREICQQPTSWIHTSKQMVSSAGTLSGCIADVACLVLTGSGSSEFAGDCVRMVLQRELGLNAQTIGGGTLLTYGSSALPPERPGLVVSVARSGDSPESVGVLSLLLKTEPAIHHLVLTCNKNGRLAETFRDHPRVTVITLPDGTNDRSLVMTSSFTNLVLAARFLGLLNFLGRYKDLCNQLSRIAADLIETHFGTLARVAKLGFRRVVYLGSGSRIGAGREAALKMLEMTAGRVSTMSESYLGFRHGPMSYAHSDALMVCFLSSEPTLRAYELDLLSELDQKELGLAKLIVGENIPASAVRKDDIVVECPGLAAAGDENAPVVHVIVGQLLAFFRCLEEGLHPDSPSEDGIINRVVQSFTLHYPVEGSGKRI
jgi:tagatose-6-phosphate ketose/aldose isomerase